MFRNICFCPFSYHSNFIPLFHYFYCPSWREEFILNSKTGDKMLNFIVLMYMTDFLVDNKNIYNIQYYFLTYFSYIVKVTLFLYIIGAVNSKSALLINVNFSVKLFIALFLIYRFNSKRTKKITFTELDRKIAFSAGLYILVVSFADYIVTITEVTRKRVSTVLQPLVSLLKS